MKNKIAIFRDILLAPSETFIRSQAESLEEFEPHYFGSRRVAGLELAKARVHVVNTGGLFGKVREARFKLLGRAPELDRFLAAIDPVLIHAHFGSGGALALPTAKRRNLPLIVTFHGSDATMKDDWSKRSHFSQRLYLRKRKELANYGRAFLAVSGFVKEKLVAAGIPEHKVHIHHIGIDPDFFQPVQLNREPIILFVGRLEKNKGCDYLILAMAKVQRKVANAELVVIGDGIERQRLENLAREVNCRCRFLGTVGPAQVKEWLNKAEVFCVPSVTADSGISEGFGLVFVEAQAMGVPVVSFRTGGIPEAVEDGVTGFLGKERDWEFLANRIRFLLENPDIRQRFAEAGRSRVCALFDLAKQARSLEGIYKQVASGTHSHESEMAGVVA